MKIVSTPPAVTNPDIPDDIEITPNLTLTQLDLSTISTGANQVSGISSTIGQAIGQRVGNTVAPSITLNPANNG